MWYRWAVSESSTDKAQQASQEPAPQELSEEQRAVQAGADAVMAAAHIKANFAAKALVEAIQGVGEKARLVTERGLAAVSEVRAHGPLVIVDGFIYPGDGNTEPFRMAVHPDALAATLVLPQDD